MPTLLDTFVVSLARLIFSSSSFAIMANKSVLGAVQYTKSDPVDAGNGLAGSPSIVQDMASILEKGVGVSSSTTLPSFSSSTSNLAFQSRVPFNTPVPTPLPSSSRLCNQAIVDVESPESKDTFPASSTTASSFNISLISDISEEDEGSDPLISSAPVTPQEATFPAGVGLGIAGLSRKDDSAPFDGLGRLYLPHQWKRPATQDIDSLSCVFSPCDRHGDLSLHSHGSTELSDIMLQEALLTFTDDPFHEHTLSSIPECRSWYELDQSGAPEEEEALPMSADKVAPPPPVSLQRRHSDKPRCTTPHFSSSTISSELKRSTSSLRKSTALSRKRSATWPTSSSSRSIGGATAVRVGSPSAALRSTSAPGWRL